MTHKEVEELYKDLHVPIHIRKHMKKVSYVAKKIAKEYQELGVEVDIESIEMAALLHDALKICVIKEIPGGSFQQEVTEEDIKKWEELKEKYPHEKDSASMCEVLSQRGEEKIANLIKKHDFACVLSDLKTLEEKILYYADKRVKHDEIVPLKERFRDGRERYVVSNEQLEQTEKIEKAIYELERELFEPLSINPEDIKE